MFEFSKPRHVFSGVWFFVSLFLCVLPVFADNTATKTPVRALSFQIAVECNCASCVFDVQRDLKKFAGVQSAKFNGKTHRIEIGFNEGTHTVSELTHAVVKSELGKGAALCWSVPAGSKAETLVKALLNVPGVQSARLDKSGLILLTFKNAPAVKLQQLDEATKGASDEK